jgi:hypothetical protein
MSTVHTQPEQRDILYVILAALTDQGYDPMKLDGDRFMVQNNSKNIKMIEVRWLDDAHIEVTVWAKDQITSSSCTGDEYWIAFIDLGILCLADFPFG